MSNFDARYEDRKRVASAIQHRRVELELTQEQLAAQAGVSLRTVQNAEACEGTLSSLSRSKLEKALNFPAGHLTRLYLSSEAVPSNHHDIVGELLSTDIVNILAHPDITPEMRRVIVTQLNREHERFARRTMEYFGLRTSRPEDGG